MDTKGFKYKPMDEIAQTRPTVERNSQRPRRWCPVFVVVMLFVSVVVLFHLHRHHMGPTLIALKPTSDLSTQDTSEINILIIESIPEQPSLRKPTTNFLVKPRADLNLTQQLERFVFKNSGITKKTDVFYWKEDYCMYLESQNVSSPYVGWADSGSFKYLWMDTNGNENETKMIDPPSGMRSSVPLGGIAAGVMELRGDGSFHEFTIFNQYPAGAAKIQQFDDMFMAVRTESEVGSVAKVLQTHPANDALDGVYAIEYRGSYPVSKLIIDEPSLPVDIAVYAYSRYKLADMNTSATPAVAFTAVLTNTQSYSVDASFMLTLPLGVENRQARSHKQFVVNMTEEDVEFYQTPVNTTTPGSTLIKHQLHRERADQDMTVKCFELCAKVSSCLSWSYDMVSNVCNMSLNEALLNGYDENSKSGVKVYWTKDGECLTVNRDTPGFNTNGNMSLCAFSTDKNVKIDATTTNSISSLWTGLSSNGDLPPFKEGASITGLTSAKVNLKPGETKEVTITLGWYFPDRDFIGVPIGNFYNNLFDNSSQAARFLGNNLQETVTDIQKIHRPFLNSDLDPTISDMLINSLSHIRSAFWLKDGRWRQWEAYDCTNIDSVHNDGERHIPYIMIFPNSTINKLYAWALYQDNSTGMIKEQLRCGCQYFPVTPQKVDYGCGRVMSDVSSMFNVYLLELLQWHPNRTEAHQVVKDLWPHAKRAAQWHIDQSNNAHSMPQYMVTTYDVLRLSAYPYSSYTGAFHLLAMKATANLAYWMDDADFAAKCNEAFFKAQKGLDEVLWNETTTHYNAYSVTDEYEFKEEEFFHDELGYNLCDYPQYHRKEWGDCLQEDPLTPGAVMTDTFYAQVLAYSLGLGPLMKSEKRLKQHLEQERPAGNCPNGLKVMNGRFTGPIVPDQDNAIWMMGDANWATLNLHLGERVDRAMDVVKQTFEYWRSELNEIWNVAGILGTVDKAYGLPTGTSHYGYFMSSWHIVFGLTGQVANFTDDNHKTLKFSPSVKCDHAYKYPIILPTLWGTLACNPLSTSSDTTTLEVRFTVALEEGQVDLDELSVDDCKADIPAGGLNSDNPASWTCTIDNPY